MKIEFLKAFNGDSIWISFIENEKPLNILIDGGTSTTYTYKDNKTGKMLDGDLKKLIDILKSKDEKLDLVILTHIDDDHIDGFLKWFKNDDEAIQNINEIWFNSGRTIKKYLNNEAKEVDSLTFEIKTDLTSVPQGVNFENHIKKAGVWDENVIKQGDYFELNGLSFQILTPSEERLKDLLDKWEAKDKNSTLDTSRKDDYKKTLKKLMVEDKFDEDDDPYNGSSISFIITHENKKYLFLADSHPSDIISELKSLGYNSKDNKLQIELLKISHHGSQKNTSVELLELIETHKYIISTNGDMHGHPDKATIARIVETNPNAKIYFNYPNLISKLILEEDKTDYPNVELLGTESL